MAYCDLFWNNRPGVWFDNKTDREKITDFYYLVVMPYNKVHRLEVESYARHGSSCEMGLEQNSRISMDASGNSYEVIWKSMTIAKDDSTSCPVDGERIAFYSRAGDRLTYPMPSHWIPAEVTARSLKVEGRRPFKVRIEAGDIVVDAPARVPVMVYKPDGAIPAPEIAQGSEYFSRIA